jgi:hypothetical protein
MENRLVIIGLAAADKQQVIKLMQGFCGLRRSSWSEDNLIVEFDLENVAQQVAEQGELRVNGRRLNIRRATPHDSKIFSMEGQAACYSFSFDSQCYVLQKPLDDGGTGAQVWIGSLLLSAWVAFSAGANLKGKRVVEIGAGLALPSFVAATYTSLVVATDCMTQILEQVNCNVVRNNLQKRVQTQVLHWNDVDKAKSCEADVVIFSDCIYGLKAAELLPVVLLHCLKDARYSYIVGVLPEFRFVTLFDLYSYPL